MNRILINYSPYLILLVNIVFFLIIRFNDLKHLEKKVEEGLKEIKEEIKCLKEIQIKHEGEINFLKGKLNNKKK